MKYKPRLTNLEIAEICEMYFGLGITIKKIACQNGVKYQRVILAIDRYFKKPKRDLLLQSKINVKK